MIKTKKKSRDVKKEFSESMAQKAYLRIQFFERLFFFNKNLE